MFYIYILYSLKLDKYYVGQTYSIRRRLERHQLGSTKFTKQAEDWKLVYSEKYPTRAEVVRRERRIKSQKSRSYIEKLIGATS